MRRTTLTIVALALSLAAGACVDGTPPTALGDAAPEFAINGYPGELNSQEARLLALNPNLASCTYSAVEKAKHYSWEYARSRKIQWTDGVRSNAYQHAIWNVLLGKECGWHFRSIDAAVWWAQAFTDAHEYGNKKQPSGNYMPMDLHNNARGREALRYYAYIYYSGGLKRVGWPDDTFLKATMGSRADKAVYFTDPKRMPTSSLVFFIKG
jgi:hypothetical protein